MRRFPISVYPPVIVSLLSWGLAGCGLDRFLSGGAEDPSSNRGACEAYVAHMNTLTPCMGVSYEVDNFCAGVDGKVVDMVPYYRCLQDNSACDGPEPVLDFDSCEPPTEAM